jgi:YD repeat-containing protein
MEMFGHENEGHKVEPLGAVGIVDALGNVATATFDAAGNQLSLRDPNSIGWNVAYDARNRAVSMADTQEQAEGKNRQTVYGVASSKLREVAWTTPAVRWRPTWRVVVSVIRQARWPVPWATAMPAA